MYWHVRPIFSRLPSAFSSMVVSPPAMLPLVGWLSDEIVDLVRLDHLVLIGLEDGFIHFSPILALIGARLGDVLRPGDLGGLAEAAVDALGDQLVVHVADRRAGGQPRRRVALAALGRHPQILDGAFLALELGGPVQELLGLVRGLGDGGDVAVALDAEADDRLAGLGDAVDHPLGPAVLDADDDDGRHVGIGAGADQGAEMQVEVGAELQPAIGMRQRQRALDVVGHGLAGGIRQIVERQDDDVVAHADAAVLAPPAAEAQVAAWSCGACRWILQPWCVLLHQRLVLRFWTCTCSPTADVGDHLADVLAVLDDGIALLERLQRDLVADRNVVLGLELHASCRSR